MEEIFVYIGNKRLSLREIDIPDLEFLANVLSSDIQTLSETVVFVCTKDSIKPISKMKLHELHWLSFVIKRICTVKQNNKKYDFYWTFSDSEDELIKSMTQGSIKAAAQSLGLSYQQVVKFLGIFEEKYGLNLRDSRDLSLALCLR